MTAEEKYAQMTQFENPLWEQGIVVAGIDEVGRGPLCGPVVAACAVFPCYTCVLGVDDSKKISENKREALYDVLLYAATAVGFGMVTADVIDRINILEATKMAMRQAFARANEEAVIRHALIDALKLDFSCPSTAIIKGDAKSFSIAAASILAKVYRDRIMREYHKQYPQYGFDRNKGYGTKDHIAAILQYGPCPIHRQTFLRKLQAEA
ncbi:MAG: ribonuclease HII [Christensenellales bacterium]